MSKQDLKSFALLMFIFGYLALLAQCEPVRTPHPCTCCYQVPDKK